jgi:predicted acylesterase/phospholipase RssA
VALGIAFEGCAGRAAFSAGVAMRLHELGILPALTAGASSGAIVAAFAAANRAPDLEDAWLSGAGRPVFQPRAVLEARWPFRMSDLVGNAVRDAFGQLTLDQLPNPVAIPVTLIGLSGRVRRTLTQADPVPVVDAVLGSCFIPGPYSRLIRIGGRAAFDGAWQLRIPVQDAKALGARRIIAVCGHPRSTLAAGFPFVRHLPIPDDCRVIQPRTDLPLGPYDTSIDRIRDAIRRGREAADVFVRVERKWLDQGV